MRKATLCALMLLPVLAGAGPLAQLVSRGRMFVAITGSEAEFGFGSDESELPMVQDLELALPGRPSVRYLRTGEGLYGLDLGVNSDAAFLAILEELQRGGLNASWSLSSPGVASTRAARIEWRPHLDALNRFRAGTFRITAPTQESEPYETSEYGE